MKTRRTRVRKIISGFVLVGMVLLGISWVSGCKPGADHHHGHSHLHESEEGEDALQKTIWSHGHEIFFEYLPLVVGEPMNFLIHVTEVDSGRPKAAEEAEIIFEQGEKVLEEKSRRTAPGIYPLTITFPEAGEWEGEIKLPGETEAVSIPMGKLVVAVKDKEPAGVEAPPEGISFSKEQQWRIGMLIEPVRSRKLVERTAIPGRTVAAPGARAAVYPLVMGRMVEQKAKLGERVEAGAILGFVEPGLNEFTARLVEAEAELVRTKAALEQAQRTLARTKLLYEQQAKSQREVQEAEIAYRAAEAAHGGAARLQELYRESGAEFGNGIMRLALRAPIDGYVSAVEAGPGERVTPEDPIFTIVDPRAMQVEAQVSPGRLNRVAAEEKGWFEWNGKDGKEREELKYLGQSQELDPVKRTLLLRYELQNREPQVAIGMMGRVWVATGVAAEGLAVTSDAVVEDDGLPVVFVQIAGETFEKRDVILGVRDGEWIEIREGISAGERVVQKGAFFLLLSTKAGGAAAHGHAH